MSISVNITAGGHAPSTPTRLLVVPNAAPSQQLILYLKTASAVGGGRGCMFAGEDLAVHYNPALTENAKLFAGISTEAATEGAFVKLIRKGKMTDSTWTWATGGALFVGPSGILTQVVPATAIMQVVGVALSATAIYVNVEPSILVV